MKSFPGHSEHLELHKRPAHAGEVVARTVEARATWGATTLLRRRFAAAGAAEFRAGMAQHLLVMNPQHEVRSVQRRGGRRVESRVADQVNLVPAFEAFAWEWEGARDYGSVHVCLDPEMLRRVGEQAGGMNPDRVELRHGFNLDDEVLRRTMFLLQLEEDGGGWGTSLYVDSLSQALALHMLRHYATCRPRDTAASGELSRPRIAAVREYIETHLARDLTLTDLAGAAGLSVSHFQRQFKLTTGVAAHRYLMDRRVERAKLLLHDKRFTHRCIHAVALACGFTDQSHLTRHFKRVVGVTPAVYRRGSGHAYKGMGDE